MTEDEVNNTYDLVNRYLTKRDKREYLTYYDNLISSDKMLVLTYAKLVEKRARKAEVEISEDLVSFQNEIGTLMGFEHRIKPFNSILEKIISDSHDYDGSYERAAKNINDSVRYTFVIPDSDYILKIDECLHKLEELGYQIIELKNKWGSLEFKGINVRLVDKKNENIFEIQFHTPMAYMIKEGIDDKTKEKSTRTLYQVSRDLNAPEWLRLKADKLRIFLQTFINVPEGALDYMYDYDIKRSK